MYSVSGYILVKDMPDAGTGANFGLENVYAASESVFDTDEKWQYVEWYGETDTDQTQIELGVRVGGYSAESKGIAYFDDIRVEKVQTLPDGVFADVWFNLDTNAGSAALSEESTQKSTGALSCWGFCSLGLRPSRAVPARRTAWSPPRPGSPPWRCLPSHHRAFALRLALGGSVAGYDVDIAVFRLGACHGFGRPSRVLCGRLFLRLPAATCSFSGDSGS
jgi:hypothetical protein